MGVAHDPPVHHGESIGLAADHAVQGAPGARIVVVDKGEAAYSWSRVVLAAALAGGLCDEGVVAGRPGEAGVLVKVLLPQERAVCQGEGLGIDEDHRVGHLDGGHDLIGFVDADGYEVLGVVNAGVRAFIGGRGAGGLPGAVLRMLHNDAAGDGVQHEGEHPDPVSQCGSDRQRDGDAAAVRACHRALDRRVLGEPGRSAPGTRLGRADPPDGAPGVPVGPQRGAVIATQADQAVAGDQDRPGLARGDVDDGLVHGELPGDLP